MKKLICFPILLTIVIFCSFTLESRISYTNVKNVKSKSRYQMNYHRMVSLNKRISYTNVFLNYLKLPKSKLLKIVSNNYDTGSIAIIESHMSMYYIFDKRLGLEFIFPSDNRDDTPIYILIDKEFNTKNYNIKGAKPGMNYKEIMKILGKRQIKKTWRSSEDIINYKISYVIGGLDFCFVSEDGIGTNSELYIFIPPSYFLKIL